MTQRLPDLNKEIGKAEKSRNQGNSSKWQTNQAGKRKMERDVTNRYIVRQAAKSPVMNMTD